LALKSTPEGVLPSKPTENKTKPRATKSALSLIRDKIAKCLDIKTNAYAQNNTFPIHK